MKEIKAFVHKHRISAVIRALQEADDGLALNAQQPRNINVAIVQSLLKPVDSEEQRYALYLGEPVIEECKLELLCEDGEADRFAAIIAAAARTGQAEAGWICISAVGQVMKIS